jgi:serine/threonine-protein kinase
MMAGGEFPVPIGMTYAVVQNHSRAAIKTALQIDETLPDAHVEQGWILFLWDWDWAGAEREFRRAIELNPSNMDAHWGYSYYLLGVGRKDESITEMKRALELDPVSIVLNVAAHAPFYNARLYDQAIEQLRRALELYPNNGGAYGYMGMSYLHKGMCKEALPLLERASELEGGSHGIMTHQAYAYAVCDQKEEAVRILRELEELSKQSYVSPFWLSIVHTGLGNRDDAIAWLEQGYSERVGAMALLMNVTPQLDPLRSDPRFQDLLRRMNFPEN